MKKRNLFTYLFQSVHLLSMKHEFYLPKPNEDFAALERVSCFSFFVAFLLSMVHCFSLGKIHMLGLVSVLCHGFFVGTEKIQLKGDVFVENKMSICRKE